MSCIRKRPFQLRPKARKRNLPRIRIFHKVECEYRRKQLAELTCILMGAFALARARADGRFREGLRKALFMTVTDPDDMALLPDFFAPPNLVMQ